MTTAIIQDGHVLSQDHQRVAEVIQDYDPDLFLAWVPPENRALDEEFPYALIHTTFGRQYVVRKLRTEDVNHSLIAWLWMNDNARNGTDLANKLEAEENARRAVELKAREEELEMKRDFAKSVLSGKNYYRHDGVLYT